MPKGIESTRICQRIIEDLYPVTNLGRPVEKGTYVDLLRALSTLELHRGRVGRIFHTRVTYSNDAPNMSACTFQERTSPVDIKG